MHNKVPHTTLKVCEFLLEDVLGIQVSQDPPANNPKACNFHVYLYPLENLEGEKRTRLRCTVTISFNSSEEFTENLQSANEWKTAVLLQTNRAVKAAFGDAHIQEEIDSKSECKFFIN